MTISIHRGDITQFKCDAIVNPANSYGYMGGGVAGAIKQIGGSEIERAAVAQAPIPVGSAVATTAGSLPCQYVIHAPTMKQPAMAIPIHNVEQATESAFLLAQSLHIKSLALPGMGTGVGRICPKDAAYAMMGVARRYDDFFESIIFIDRNQSMVDAFTAALDAK